MLIGIDGNEANNIRKVGIGCYAYELLNNIYKINSLQAGNIKNSFRIYLKDTQNKSLPETQWWKYKVLKPRLLWTQFALPLRLFSDKEKPDVFFSLTHYAPRIKVCKTAISIMDLSYIRFPEMFTRKDLWQLRNWTAYSVKNADIIFTISKFSKKEIMDYYKLNSEKIVVTYPGYDKDKYQITNIKDQKEKLKIKNNYLINDDYILFVGTLQPRKNIVRLLEAFNSAMEQLNNKVMQLVIIGKKGWLYEEVFQKVKELNLGKRIIFTDYVSDEDLPDLYRGAKCFVLPSLYEGFGLPVLEAMASGCPVIVSNISSLPEVVGKAGIMIDPFDSNDIARGILEILKMNDTRYNMQKRLSIEQAHKFSWVQCAKVTLDNLTAQEN